MFAKRVSEHLMGKKDRVTSDSGENEAKVLLKTYFERYGKFTSESDLNKVDGVLHNR